MSPPALAAENGTPEIEQIPEFTEAHHALLFAWLAQAVLERVGEQRGEEVLRAAVRQYGEERGRRMALRAEANGHERSMLNYLAYTEFKTARGEMDMQVQERVPHVRIAVSKCPWHTLWSEHDLLPFGRFYCLEIDQAVVRGFNPDLQLDVAGIRTDGAPHCEFVFHDANVTLPNYLKLGYRKAVKPGSSAVMPWDYHVGHLFSAVERVAVSALGQAGREAIDAGLARFAERFGAPAAQRVLARRDQDYGRLPELR